ncbi:MAG TPA: ABC transporter permease, partial [Candidatus Eisenbacteria bacterium]|nr:ABC transporter permease [Candidatus Eisenbacteria bacterium]
GNYLDVISAFPSQFANSLVYGGLATVLCFLIGYPLAYGIAFRGGRYKTLLLFLVIAPFFTNFLIRTISWKILLGNDGPALAILRDGLGLVPRNFNILGTPLAVVSGLTYQFLPFMVLPLYVALEKIDQRLLEAARDLYAGPWRRPGVIVGGIGGALLATAFLLGLGYAEATPAGLLQAALPIVGAGVIGAAIASLLISETFVRVIFPLSLSGVFAGSILTFIPAIGDFVNVELLGNTRTQMIGNVIQNRYLAQNDYPTAAALSFMLMAAILIAILVYARALGTEELSGGRA